MKKEGAKEETEKKDEMDEKGDKRADTSETDTSETDTSETDTSETDTSETAATAANDASPPAVEELIVELPRTATSLTANALSATATLNTGERWMSPPLPCVWELPAVASALMSDCQCKTGTSPDGECTCFQCGGTQRCLSCEVCSPPSDECSAGRAGHGCYATLGANEEEGGEDPSPSEGGEAGPDENGAAAAAGSDPTDGTEEIDDIDEADHGDEEAYAGEAYGDDEPYSPSSEYNDDDDDDEIHPDGAEDNYAEDNYADDIDDAEWSGESEPSEWGGAEGEDEGDGSDKPVQSRGSLSEWVAKGVRGAYKRTQLAALDLKLRLVGGGGGGGGGGRAGADEYVHPEAERLRMELRELESSLNTLRGTERTLKKNLEEDFGPESVFYALKGQCFAKDTGEWTYEVCPFGDTFQKDKSGGSTRMGKFDGFEGVGENRYGVMRFTGGQVCWNAGARECRVSLECGAENRVLDVAEPEVCRYAMRLATPAACTETLAQEAQAEAEAFDAHKKDEL